MLHLKIIVKFPRYSIQTYKIHALQRKGAYLYKYSSCKMRPTNRIHSKVFYVSSLCSLYIYILSICFQLSTKSFLNSKQDFNDVVAKTLSLSSLFPSIFTVVTATTTVNMFTSFWIINKICHNWNFWDWTVNHFVLNRCCLWCDSYINMCVYNIFLVK